MLKDLATVALMAAAGAFGGADAATAPPSAGANATLAKRTPDGSYPSGICQIRGLNGTLVTNVAYTLPKGMFDCPATDSMTIWCTKGGSKKVTDKTVKHCCGKEACAKAKVPKVCILNIHIKT